MDWLEVARQLPLGHKRRIAHDCSEAKDMLVSHGEAGYSAYCFRCGNVGFEGHGYQTLAEIERLKELNATAKEAHTHELPNDFVHEIPKYAAGWLFRAGVSLLLAKASGIGWSERLQRIILPVRDEHGATIYWQARAVHKGQSPKYINPPVDKASILFAAGPAGAGTARVVVTEDILSAIRVGQHVPARCIMGTKTSDQQAAALSEFDEVIYWLDPDDAGREGNRTGTRKLSLVTDARAIESEADPKNLSDRRIRELLGLHPNHRYEVFT
jgi:DNA primase